MESGGAATGQSALERELIGVLEPSPSRQAMSNAGERNSKWGENFGEVVCCGFPFHIGTECEDYFGRTVFFDSTKKRFDAELLGTDVVEWREASAQGVVKPAKNAAAFEREDIGRLFDHAEFLVLPSGLGADAA